MYFQGSKILWSFFNPPKRLHFSITHKQTILTFENNQTNKPRFERKRTSASQILPTSPLQTSKQYERIKTLILTFDLLCGRVGAEKGDFVARPHAEEHLHRRGVVHGRRRRLIAQRSPTTPIAPRRTAEGRPRHARSAARTWRWYWKRGREILVKTAFATFQNQPVPTNPPRLWCTAAARRKIWEERLNSQSFIQVSSINPCTWWTDEHTPDTSLNFLNFFWQFAALSQKIHVVCESLDRLVETLRYETDSETWSFENKKLYKRSSPHIKNSSDASSTHIVFERRNSDKRVGIFMVDVTKQCSLLKVTRRYQTCCVVGCWSFAKHSLQKWHLI